MFQQISEILLREEEARSLTYNKEIEGDDKHFPQGSRADEFGGMQDTGLNSVLSAQHLMAGDRAEPQGGCCQGRQAVCMFVCSRKAFLSSYLHSVTISFSCSETVKMEESGKEEGENISTK